MGGWINVIWLCFIVPLIRQIIIINLRWNAVVVVLVNVGS